jgi:hypothetical protein
MPTTIAAPVNPLKFRIYSEATKGLVRRSITVEHESQDSYRVRVRDLVPTDAQNHGLHTGDLKAEPAQTMLYERVTPASTTLEKANAQALVIFDNYRDSGWK